MISAIPLLLGALVIGVLIVGLAAWQVIETLIRILRGGS
jgi:hypothetical protein